VGCSDVVLLFPNDIPFHNRITIVSDPDVSFPLQFPNLGTLATEGSQERPDQGYHIFVAPDTEG